MKPLTDREAFQRLLAGEEVTYHDAWGFFELSFIDGKLVTMGMEQKNFFIGQFSYPDSPPVTETPGG